MSSLRLSFLVKDYLISIKIQSLDQQLPSVKGSWLEGAVRHYVNVH